MEESYSRIATVDLADFRKLVYCFVKRDTSKSLAERRGHLITGNGLRKLFPERQHILRLSLPKKQNLIL